MKKFIMLSLSFAVISLSHAMDTTASQIQGIENRADELLDQRENATDAIRAYKEMQKVAPELAELADIQPARLTIKNVKKTAAYCAQELGGPEIFLRFFKPIEHRTQEHEPCEVFVLQRLRKETLAVGLAAESLLDYTSNSLSTQQDAENLSKRIMLTHLALSVLLERSEEKLKLLQKIEKNGFPEKQPDYRWKGSE